MFLAGETRSVIENNFLAFTQIFKTSRTSTNPIVTDTWQFTFTDLLIDGTICKDFWIWVAEGVEHFIWIMWQQFFMIHSVETVNMILLYASERSIYMQREKALTFL